MYPLRRQMQLKREISCQEFNLHFTKVLELGG